MVSDLGGGKTVFTKGLVKGTGSKDLVSSPTFTISKIYKAPNFEINHFDFYRLGSGGIVSLELQEVLGNPKIVTIIEWANVVSDVLPKNRLKILIENMGQNSRNLIFNYQKEAKYLLKGLIK